MEIDVRPLCLVNQIIQLNESMRAKQLSLSVHIFLKSCCGLLVANTIECISTAPTVAAMFLHEPWHNKRGWAICPNTSGKAFIWNPTSILPGTGNTDCVPVPAVTVSEPPTCRIGTTTPPYYAHCTFTRSQDIIRSRRKLLLCRLSIEIL